MGKFYKPGKVVVVLNGRFAGHKGIIVKSNYESGKRKPDIDKAYELTVRFELLKGKNNRPKTARANIKEDNKFNLRIF